VIDSALQEFISEGEEIIHRVSEVLQKIEKSDSTPELLSALYRDVHTLKGNAQLFGFQKIGLLSHTMEASLDPIRELNVTIAPRLIESCFSSLDLLLRMLKAIQNGDSEKNYEREVNLKVYQLIDSASNQFGAEILLTKDFMILQESIPVEKPVEEIPKVVANEVKPVKVKPVEIKPAEVSPTSSLEKLLEQKKSVPMNKKPELEAPKQVSKPTAKIVEETIDQNPAKSNTDVNQLDTTIRVPVSLLDRLMNLVGELVLVRNQFLQYRNEHEDLELMSLSKNLDVVTSDLQTEVMQTRMQPIGNVISKFQRVVRDIANDLKKKIDLTLEGSETELDKTLLEATKDPLTHLLRNSCDHGIEDPSERKKAGKPESGHILIRSYHEGGQVVIEISDDGKGLDSKKILAKAIEKGLINSEHGSKLQEREIFNMIFLPGFSTAKQVTSVSGRGVGMDVVKTNIEKIGGVVELSSVVNKGTTVRLKIPLTLAIVPAMLIRSGKEKFASPQVKLVELVRVEGSDPKNRIEFLQGRPMYRLRGSLLPLLDIREIIGDRFTPGKAEVTNIVVLSVEKEFFGLIVEEILDTADIVVKPLSSFLKKLSIFSGATILGDGSIALILDVMGMANSAHINTKKTASNEHGVHVLDSKKASTDIQEFLLFNLGTGVTHAIPLCLVHRLEEFEQNEIERSGEQRVMRYRDSLLPILNLYQILGYDKKKPYQEKEKLSIIVVQRSGKNYGIEVSEIMDIVSIEDQIDDSIRDRPGILGNIIHQESVVVIVDALGVVEKVAPSGKQQSTQSAIEDIRNKNREMKSKKIRVLYAEDVVFFRRHVSKVLIDAGFEITLAEDGQKALEILDASQNDQFNLILSDIEMPRMTGLELAREVRKRSRFQNIPLIALTTRFKDKDIEEGKQSGFNDYLEKLNPDKLLNSIESLLGTRTGNKEGNQS